MASLALLAFATPTLAARYYEVTVTGTLNSELGYPPWEYNTGVDPNLSVGSTLTMTAKFDKNWVATWGDNGYSVAGIYGLSTSGEQFWRIDGGGMTWSSRDDLMDGYPPFYVFDYSVDTDPPEISPPERRELSGPAIIFDGERVLGLMGDLYPLSSRPLLSLGSEVPYGGTWCYNLDFNEPVICESDFPAAQLSSSLSVRPGNANYNNIYPSQGFSGTWDFANSTVLLTGVPEPQTWALMIAGFGLTGSFLRRARHTPLPA